MHTPLVAVLFPPMPSVTIAAVRLAQVFAAKDAQRGIDRRHFLRGLIADMGGRDPDHV